MTYSIRFTNAALRWKNINTSLYDDILWIDICHNFDISSGSVCASCHEPFVAFLIFFLLFLFQTMKMFRIFITVQIDIYIFFCCASFEFDGSVKDWSDGLRWSVLGIEFLCNERMDWDIFSFTTTFEVKEMRIML